MVEREGIGITHKRLTDTREQQAQQGIYIGVGAYRRARVRSRLPLLDDDGDGQIFNITDMWTTILRQILLGKGREGVIQLPPRLGCDGIQHQR